MKNFKNRYLIPIKKIFLFFYYYLINYDKISIIPYNLGRVFSFSYWYTMIHITNKRFKYKQYENETWHNISKVDQFNFKEWKFVTFEKLKDRNIDSLIKQINKNKKKNISILEVGCGAGEIGARLLLAIKNKKKINYCGLDFSKQNIIEGKKGFKKLIKDNKIEWNFINKNFLRFDIKNKKKFDFVFCSSVIEMINDNKINIFIKKLCEKSKEGVFLNENADKHFYSNIRNHKNLRKMFTKYNFSLDFFEYKIEKIQRKNNKYFEFMRLITYFRRVNF